ncbi:MAG: UDP-N-acetylmuramate dehydrogenase [Gammaproteobacteria bacterium]
MPKLSQTSLARYTTWKTGGVADSAFVPEDKKALCEFLKTVPAPVAWLGLGSNTLVSDHGVKQPVIIMQGGGLNHIERLDDSTVRAEAGVACSQFARHCARLGLRGVEFLAGVPGTIGGALAMNAGCYGGETWEHVIEVETVDHQGHFYTRAPKEFDVSYRHVERPNQEYFVSGTFRLTPGDRDTALKWIKDMIAKRNASQPTNFPNCGSVFRNPQGDYAARLIEASGLKGFRCGGAQISEKHANFIVNHGDATSDDIYTLIQLIQRTVREKQGVDLQHEVKFLGESFHERI